MPYKEGYDYNWNYTLSQWVVFYLSNKYLKPFSAAKTAQHKGFKIETDIDFEDNEFNYRYMGGQRRQPLRRQPARKPELKCHFCNLEYCLDDERKEHEEFWHRDKITKSTA